MKNNLRPSCGFTLVELLIGVALAALLTTGATKLALATGRSYLAQQNLGLLQENARLAFNALAADIQAAGFRHEPWNPDTEIRAIGPGTRDSATSLSDLLELRRWSNRNCFDNPNPALDASGQPSYYLRETEFRLGASGNLAKTCRYGQDAENLTTQVNNLGLVQNVESFQVLFAEDSDEDGDADRWVGAGDWQSERGVKAARVALLLATPDSLDANASQPLQVLDELVQPAADGRKRMVLDATFDIRGRKT